MATPETEADLEQCNQEASITSDDAQLLADLIDAEYQCSMLMFCDGETLLTSEKMKMKKTVGLEDDEMCGTCIEMFEDMITLISTDMGKAQLEDSGDVVCNICKAHVAQ